MQGTEYRLGADRISGPVRYSVDYSPNRSGPVLIYQIGKTKILKTSIFADYSLGTDHVILLIFVAVGRLSLKVSMLQCCM